MVRQLEPSIADDMMAWRAEHRASRDAASTPDFLYLELVQEAEILLGRAARPFHLTVFIQPTSTEDVWDIGHDTLIVSADLRARAGDYKTAIADHIRVRA
ncbi:hypothetical protein M3147_04270 [Agromyces mediolanus]|uniref:hypothetical protein n=1 Tax=Agromyces mediolanus TaxID=41986 RepID=UPI00203C379D|nr:hypothetical protein [Agromyces mediolanus]MCM3656460.1 hypothetical protein [Agromyces mediolanus]